MEVRAVLKGECVNMVLNKKDLQKREGETWIRWSVQLFLCVCRRCDKGSPADTLDDRGTGPIQKFGPPIHPM